MGLHGCVWVKQTRSYLKTRLKETKNGHAVHIFGPMVGEIFPNIMFCDDSQKLMRMGVGGHKWVCMGDVGCRYTGGTKNKRKRGLNDRE